MTEGFVKLYCSILDSSVWSLDSDTRIVWITLMAMADPQGRVHAAIPGIARRAQVSNEVCEKAMNVFQEPDKYSRSTEFEGRRIERDGRDWVILNFEEHRKRQVAENIRQSKLNYYHRNKNKNQMELENTRNALEKTRDIAEAEAEAEADTNTEERKHSCAFAEKSTSAKRFEYPGWFERFWNLYPRYRRRNKKKAFDAYTKVLKQCRTTTDEVEAKLKILSKSQGWLRNNGQFVPLPTTWLNGGGWDDEPDNRQYIQDDGVRYTAQEQAYMRSQAAIDRAREEIEEEEKRNG